MKPSTNARFSKPRKTSNFALPAALLVFSLLLSSCAGYRLGPTNGMVAGSRSIQVVFFQNETPEPRLAEPVATALRRALQQDGTFRLATREGGDYLVEGALVEFDRSGLSFDPRDVLTVRDYELIVTARFTVKETATGKVILNTSEYGRTAIRAGADLPSAERQAMPLLAEDLARKITGAIVDGSW